MSSSTPAAANEQKPLRLPLNQQNDFFNDYFQKNDLFDYSNNKASIRFLIFNEDSTGIRSLLFDHNSLRKTKQQPPTSPINSNQSPPILLLNGGGGGTTPISPKSLNPPSRSSSDLSTNSPIINKLNYNKFKPMVYGTMPMIVSNQNSMKVHSMRSINKIMISNVFNYTPQICDHQQQVTVVANDNNNKQNNNKNGFHHQINSCEIIDEKSSCDNDDENSIKRQTNASNPVPIIINQPLQHQVKTSSSFISSVHSNHSISPCSSMPTTTTVYGASYDCSVYKRLMRSMSSSLSLSSSQIINNNFEDNYLNDSLLNTNINNNEVLICKHHYKCLRNSKFKIGIAIIFSLKEKDNNENFYEFFYSHLPIIECQIFQLRSNIIDILPSLFNQSRSSLSNIGNRLNNVGGGGNNLSSSTVRLNKEFHNFCLKFESLCNSPRLSKPAWLTIVQNNNIDNDVNKSKQQTCNKLINDFVYLYDHLNKKDLFFSKIIGTILKYNLSWLTTVLPNEHCVDINDYKLRKRKALWTQILESNNHYNCQWAQLGDLHGAIGDPLILTRAVVVGSNKEIITRLLFVLSYFIRCSASSFYDVKQEIIDFEDILAENGENSLNLSNEFLNCIDDTQREINIFDLNTSSPIHHHHRRPNNESFNKKLDICELNGVDEEEDEDNKKTSSRDNSYVRSNSSNNSSKQRHISSNSLGENCNAQELPLIGLKINQNYSKSTRIQDNFGYSLLAGYCDKFVFEFVLHGTSDKTFLDKLHNNLKFSKQNSILDTPIHEANYLVIDTDLNEVKVYSSETEAALTVEKPINLVDSILKSVYELNQCFKNNDFLLLHLEDELQKLYFKSKCLYSLQTQERKIDENRIMKLIELKDKNDYDFLNNIIKAIIVPKI